MENKQAIPADSIQTEQQMEEDLAVLSACYDSMGIGNERIPASQLIPLPTLTAVLSDEKGCPRVISHSWLPMPREVASLTKYLQFYSEMFLPKLDRLTLLEGVTAINDRLPLGHCFLVRPEQKPEVLGLRWVQSLPAEERPNPGCFAENVVLFDYSCQVAQTFMDALADGKTISQALELLQ